MKNWRLPQRGAASKSENLKPQFDGASAPLSKHMKNISGSERRLNRRKPTNTWKEFFVQKGANETLNVWLKR